jgi:hypothetical protein
MNAMSSMRLAALWALLPAAAALLWLACGDDDDDDSEPTGDDDFYPVDDDAADDDAADDDQGGDDDTVPPYTGDDDFAAQCRAYFRDCFSASPAEQNQLCGWLEEQQEEFTDCVKWAMAHLFDCLEQNVTCNDLSDPNLQAIDDCIGAYVDERDACFE